MSVLIMISFTLLIFIIIFSLCFPFYIGLAKLFNKVEEKITGIKKQDPKNKNLPLKELSKIRNLSLRDTFFVYVIGFFPFMGYLFLPQTMEKLNITDYYELRFQSRLERLKQHSNKEQKKGFDYKFKSFKDVRAYTAKYLCFISTTLYMENITHFLEYLAYLGFPVRGIQPQSLSGILFFLNSQLSMNFFESTFIKCSWLLLLATIFYYSWKYWSLQSKPPCSY